MQYTENTASTNLIKENLRELIIEELQSCEDEELLDLIWKLLIS